MDDQQLLRYSKHLLLPQVDYEGQMRIMESRIAILGLGAVGGAVAQHLVTAGVQQLLLLDHHLVTEADLGWQPLHTTDTLHMPKAESARLQLQKHNTQAQLVCDNQPLERDQLMRYLQSVDLVIDCSNSFAERYQCNELCVGLRKPLFTGSCVGFEGQILCLNATQTDAACYQCVFADGDDLFTACPEQGVLAPMGSVIGSHLAILVLQHLLGKKQHNLLLQFNTHEQTQKKFKLHKDSACPVC